MRRSDLCSDSWARKTHMCELFWRGLPIQKQKSICGCPCGFSRKRGPTPKKTSHPQRLHFPRFPTGSTLVEGLNNCTTKKNKNMCDVRSRCPANLRSIWHLGKAEGGDLRNFVQIPWLREALRFDHHKAPGDSPNVHFVIFFFFFWGGGGRLIKILLKHVMLSFFGGLIINSLEKQAILTMAQPSSP